MSFSNPTLAEVRQFAGNFAPRSWAFCDGQLLAVSQYDALFSLLGTTYGGDGRTTFGLPDLRGRTPVGTGTGAGLRPNVLGQRGGFDTVTLTMAALPSHNHTMTLHGETTVADKRAPGGKMLAGTPSGTPIYADPIAADNQVMAPQSITVRGAGGSQAYGNMNPYLGINYVIALQGIYPSRS